MWTLKLGKKGDQFSTEERVHGNVYRAVEIAARDVLTLVEADNEKEKTATATIEGRFSKKDGTSLHEPVNIQLSITIKRGK